MCDRDEFESAVKGLCLNNPLGWSEGEYESNSTQALWDIWQAARAQGRDAPTDNDIPELDELCEQYNSGHIDLTSLVCRVWNTAHNGAQGGEAVAWSLKWPEDVSVNASTTFSTKDLAQRYAKGCQGNVAVVPLYTRPQPLPSASVPEGLSQTEWVGFQQRSGAWLEVTRLLDEVFPEWRQSGGSGKENALSAITKLATYFLTTTPQPVDNWIKCSERLPDLVGHYDACTPTYGGRYPDAYWNGERWEDEMDGLPIRGVTHFCSPKIPEQG